MPDTSMTSEQEKFAREQACGDPCRVIMDDSDEHIIRHILNNVLEALADERKAHALTKELKEDREEDLEFEFNRANQAEGKLAKEICDFCDKQGEHWMCADDFGKRQDAKVECERLKAQVEELENDDPDVFWL